MPTIYYALFRCFGVGAYLDGGSCSGCDMDEISKLLAELEAALLERRRKAEADESRAADVVRRATRQLEIVSELKALSGGAVTLPEGGEVDVAGDERPAYDRRGVLERLLGPGVVSPPFAPIDRDDETGEPVYDSRVVAGKRNNRQRVFAAARVYGPELREASLADAIFSTGETRARSAQSVRSSLGVLIRYGKGWERDRGTLTYVGNDLTPNKEFILVLLKERDEKRRQVEVGNDSFQSDEL